MYLQCRYNFAEIDNIWYADDVTAIEKLAVSLLNSCEYHVLIKGLFGTRSLSKSLKHWVCHKGTSRRFQYINCTYWSILTIIWNWLIDWSIDWLMSLINHKIKNTHPMLHNKNCVRIYNNVAKSKLCTYNRLCSKMSLFCSWNVRC